MPKLVKVNKRNQVSLGDAALYETYFLSLESDGTITLSPAVVVPAKWRDTGDSR